MNHPTLLVMALLAGAAALTSHAQTQQPASQLPGTSNTTTTAPSTPKSTAPLSAKQRLQTCMADQKANHPNSTMSQMKKACKDQQTQQKTLDKNSTVPQLQ